MIDQLLPVAVAAAGGILGLLALRYAIDGVFDRVTGR